MVFTDIQGSTRLLDELGERYADVLAEHRRVLRDAFSRHGGVEVDTQGDAFFAVFARAGDAIAAAADAQAGLDGGPVSVRIGVHTGEPVVTDEGYVGIDVHRGARIMAAAHGGQVLVSEATARLLEPGAKLRDLGEHRLKDLSAPQRLFQLGSREFPPLRTLYRTNLPIQATPLVGRESELEEATELICAKRLLTLIGPGGSGKTRLALQLAADAIEQFPDGVFWVPLQALRDPALVERAIGASLGADDGLSDYVGNKQLLVVVDNFEQVIEAAPVVAALLAATPNAKALVTSREPLQIEFEHRYPVEPLPDDAAALLFVERASAVAPGFRASGEVSEICRRLDGLPLAIELAAARVALLDPSELLARLDRRLPLLASRSRDAPTRQQTLRATIAWSYELLPADEQDLFRRLAVFRGSFSLDAAEAVCGASLDLLESLVVKSLVRRWGSGRLGMLDTIREYAVELHEAAPDADEVYRRHAEHFLDIAEAANLNAGTRRPGGQRLDVALAEQDNFRAALAWTLRCGSVALGIEIAVALEQFWVLEDPEEGIRWFDRLFEQPAAAVVAPSVRAEALRAEGSALGISGHWEAAEEMWTRSLALFEELGDDHGRAVLLHRLGISAMLRGNLAEARTLVEESDAIHRRDGDLWGMAQTVGTLGAIARDEGDERNARQLVRESATLAREARVPWWEGGMLAELACLSLNAGLIDEGEEQARASLTIARQLQDRAGRIFGVGLLAWVAAERGLRERAGVLWGAVEGEDATSPHGGWRLHRKTCEARVLEVAGPEFECGRTEGTSLTLDDAVAIALA